MDLLLESLLLHNVSSEIKRWGIIAITLLTPYLSSIITHFWSILFDTLLLRLTICRELINSEYYSGKVKKCIKN